MSVGCVNTIIAPEQVAKWDFSASNTITWVSVDTDSNSFQVILVSLSNSSMDQSVIAKSVKTSESKYTFLNIVTPVG